MKKLRSIVLPLFTSMILASCGSGLEGVTGGNPPPTPPAPPTLVFIPQAGAPVNSGNGTVIGTVRISPNAQEVEVMHLINEVRTKGTIHGQNTIAGSCMEGKFVPGALEPLTYNGSLSYAARKHAVYMTESGDYSHTESQPEHPAFFGASALDRLKRARIAFGESPDTWRQWSENIAFGYTTGTIVMREWMMSPVHCNNLMDTRVDHMAVGYQGGSGTWGTDSYKFISWVQMFGK